PAERHPGPAAGRDDGRHRRAVPRGLAGRPDAALRTAVLAVGALRGRLCAMRDALLFLLVGLLGCAGGGLAPAARPSEADTAGVLEAVYRYQMTHDARPDTEAFCLCGPADSREGADPPAEFLKRFASGARPVLACSACAVEEGRVIEKKSGKTALSFF